jgi:hypothetical protein
MQPLSFRDKHVLVTGGGQGIGRITARLFAERGGLVTLADLDDEAGNECEAAILAAAGTAQFIHADVADEREVTALFHKADERFGPVSVLINNAGFGSPGTLFTRPFAEWQRVIAVNLGGVYLCSRAAAGQMREAGGGAIVNIASTRALMSEPDTEPYSASKGGIVALTHSLAVSLGQYAIRVNAVSPGWIDVSSQKKSSAAHQEHLREIDHLQHPARRVGRGDDIAWACLYLASEQSGFITGTNLVVDGGMTIRMIYEE